MCLILLFDNQKMLMTIPMNYRHKKRWQMTKKKNQKKKNYHHYRNIEILIMRKKMTMMMMSLDKVPPSFGGAFVRCRASSMHSRRPLQFVLHLQTTNMQMQMMMILQMMQMQMPNRHFGNRKKRTTMTMPKTNKFRLPSHFVVVANHPNPDIEWFLLLERLDSR